MAGWLLKDFHLQNPDSHAYVTLPIALTLLRYPQAVEGVAQSLEPHRLCGYIYDLAGAFSSFFESCPVLTAPDDATRNARLRLCDLTARVLADGLKTLGIPTVERM